MSRIRTLKALAAKWNEIWQDFRSPLGEKAREARASTRRLQRFIQGGATGVELQCRPKDEHPPQYDREPPGISPRR
jgi:hypothetical protein